MNQTDEKLLLTDLCARLPYSPKVAFYMFTFGYKQVTLRSINPTEETYRIGNQNYSDFSRIKPYLRPMSSMTDEEKKEFSKCFYAEGWMDKEYLPGELLHWKLDDGYPSFEMELCSIPNAIDFLNSNHFDYRGLIPKGLAVKAPEGMYKF